MTSDEKLKIICSWCFSYHKGETFVGFVYNILAAGAGVQIFNEFFYGEQIEGDRDKKIDKAYGVVKAYVRGTVEKIK
jgi:hypothetical protein